MILDDILVQAQNRRRPSRGLPVRMALWSRWGSINDQEMKMKWLRMLQKMKKKHEPNPKKIQIISKRDRLITRWFWTEVESIALPRALTRPWWVLLLELFHFHFFISSFSSLFSLSVFIFLVYWQDPGESLCRIIGFRSLNWTLMIAPFV